jgi:hypothetical protein
MQPLLYILRKVFINTIKELRKKPALLSLYIVLFVIMLGVIIISFFSSPPSNQGASPELFEIAVTLGLLIVTYIGIRKGIARGGSFFRTSDVNLVFTAPISPKKVLIYGFIKQIFRTLLTLAFLYFQIPNIRNSFHIDGSGLVIIYVVIFVLLLSMEFIGFFVYTVSSASVRWRSRISKGMDLIVAIIAVIFVLSLFQTDSLLQAAKQVFLQQWITYVPYVGWYQTIMMSAVNGVTVTVYISAGLLLLLYAIMVFILYNWKTDYYEGVMEATELKESLLQARKEGKGNLQASTFKIRSVKKMNWQSGAGAIMSRHLLEYRKSGLFFFNAYTLLLVVIGISSKYIPLLSDLKLLLYVSIYILMFTVMTGKWARELDKPYIYMIPASSASKLFYATLAEIVKMAIDGAVLFTTAGIMLGSTIWEIVMAALAYMTFGMIFIYGDVLSRRLLGPTHSAQLHIFLKLFITLFIIAPGLIASLIIGFKYSSGTLANELLVYTIVIVYNLLASTVILLTSKGIFDKLEMK